VILQILSSFAMHMLSSGQINPALSSWLASWYHILSGLLVVILSLLLAADSLTRRGFHYFFPYLWGDTEQLKKDIQASLRFKMVPPRPKGLATAVQGLGLGALLLVVLSGLIWFILWRNGSSFAGLALETHKNVTLLIELYLIGHGCMALLHFFVWQRNKARQE
ncbi:MAG: cytochrome b/b6 domain-containing protein, partial [Bilophila wadsworthia]